MDSTLAFAKASANAIMPAMPRITSGSVAGLGYSEAGKGPATPIVFLHGVGSDKSVWRPQLQHFGKARRAVAFDYPGYGGSDPAAKGTSRDDYATAIASAMRKLGIARAHICGLSLGGVVAVSLHHHAPELCASLIIADSFAAHPDGQGIYDRSIAGSANLHAMAKARVDVLLAQPADPKIRRNVVATMSKIDSAAYRIGAEAVWLADQADRARAIDVPTLVVCGTKDTITPPQLSAELRDLIPGSELVLITGAGHLSNLEKPMEFNAAVDRFLRGAETAA